MFLEHSQHDRRMLDEQQMPHGQSPSIGLARDWSRRRLRHDQETFSDQKRVEGLLTILALEPAVNLRGH